MVEDRIEGMVEAMIAGTETCVYCGKEFDYETTSKHKTIKCPHCHKKQAQCNLCDNGDIDCKHCTCRDSKAV